jgi:para-nitrobenzyl esterase
MGEEVMRRSLGFVAIAAALGLSLLAACRRGSEPAAPKTADPTSMRDLSTGWVVGFASHDGAQAWLGIPYAQPRVGDLRWRAPQPPEKWRDTREALSYASACPQNANALGGVPDWKPGTVIGSEDCLYLNVFTRSATVKSVTERRMPVMVWIHGGGNTVGQAGSYDGSALAAKRDVVVVTVNYRLGPFGWFRHPALVASAANENDASGNFGTLDLIRALEWVKRDIAAFGGDPNNVTIFGESAGATDVFSLLLAPRAKGLFHRAIAESGDPSTSSLARAANAKSAAEPGDAHSSAEVTPRILFPDLPPAEAVTRAESLAPAEVAAGLRAATPQRILAAYKGDGEEFGGMIDMPMVLRDGHVLPTDDGPTLLAAGRYNKVPVVIGSNRDEIKLFMFGDRRQVRWWFGFLPRAKDARHYELSAEYATLGWKLGGVDEPASWMRAAQGPSVYAYRFDWDEEPSLLWSDFSQLLGAAHGIEIPFVFASFETSFFGRVFTEKNRPGRESLAEAVTSYWTQFAYTGDPGRGRDGSLTPWKAWDPAPGGPKFVILDTPEGGGVRMHDKALTRDTLLAQFGSDSRMDDSLRCELFAEYVKHHTFASTDREASGCSEEGLAEVAAR